MPLWIMVAVLVVVALALQCVTVYRGIFPKRVFIPTLAIGGLLTLAAYYHSWWIVMCTFFVWIYKYMENEFDNVRECLAKMDEKLDGIAKSSVSSTAP